MGIRACNPIDRRTQRGFTLTELLVAIALLMIIMVGVATVFRTTGDTISAGVAINDLNRRLNAARTTLGNDIAGYHADPFGVGPGMMPVNGPAGDRPPFLMIRGERTSGYLNREQWTGGVANQQDYRTDILAFFAKGIFKRQTGEGTDLFVPMSASSAYVWYGHLWLPKSDNPDDENDADWYYNGVSSATTMTHPGYGAPETNPNNFFAAQWTLGRMALLMAQPMDIPALSNPHAVLDLRNQPVTYIGRDEGKDTDPKVLSPLSVSSNSWDGTGTMGPPYIQWSRYDVVGTTAGLTWDEYGGLVARVADPDDLDYVEYWAENKFRYRFRATPNIDLDDATAGPDDLARTVPVYLSGCVNFIVEFAGDYIAQNSDGTLVAPYGSEYNRDDPGVDDVIDFNVAADGRRTIRWYGFPRDADGDGSDTSGGVNPSAYKDPMPVWYSRWGRDIAFRMPFENDSDATFYNCAWSRNEFETSADPDSRSMAPRLIRITIQVVDPEGHVDEGMTRQFVFPVRFN